MDKWWRGWMMALLALTGGMAWANPPDIAGMSGGDYDFYPGDFNGDGYTDLLYIAKDPARSSGILLSDGTSLSIPLQTWGNAFLGIPWSSGLYTVVVADFNGDGKADILLQRNSPGDSYLLLTEDGVVSAISQTIADWTAGVAWSADQHHIVVGDFNGDGRADVFLQATTPAGLNAIILSDGQGQFTARAPAQSWNDGYLGFNWATSEALIFSGDFNGDGYADLLIQARPAAGTGLTNARPALFPPHLNGVALAQPGAKMFVGDHIQAWSRYDLSADWSPLDSAITVGDFNGDGRSDVMLQGLSELNPTYVLYGHAPGRVFTPASSLSSTVAATANDYRAIAGHFQRAAGDGVLLVGQTAALGHSLGHLNANQLTTSPLSLNSSAAPASLLLATTAGPAPSIGAAPAAIVAANAAGRTPGQFAVAPTGAATYSIPIWTPPGARGIAPHLSLAYVSGGADGAVGPGWALGGLSSLTRCNKTFAENGAPAPVSLTSTDDFCLGGNRLRLTAGTYGAAGSTYQTEMANFSNITAYSSAGNGPSYFIVQGKDGLYYEYGNTTDSKAYTNGGSTPYAWLINKIRDRQGNNLTVAYSTSSGWVQPVSIHYTQTPATGTAYPYAVAFTYQNRVTNVSKYIAGGSIVQTQVLGGITVSSSGTAVRQYNLAYATAPTTQRDRLSTIQECAGASCLQPTTIAYVDGAAGVATPTTATGSGATNGAVYSVDIDGDGRQDLVFATTVGTTYHWWVQFATATGYRAPVSTGAVTPAGSATVASAGVPQLQTDFLIDSFDGTGTNQILAPVGGYWNIYRWNGSAFTATPTTTPVTAGNFSSLDVDGDGLPDLVSVTNNSTTVGAINVSIWHNLSKSGSISFAAAATWSPVIYTNVVTVESQYGNNQLPNSSLKKVDFDGDGRDDLLLVIRIPTFKAVAIDVFPLLSRGLAAPAVGTFGFGDTRGIFQIAVGNWNDDACTDLIANDQVFVAPCNGTQPVTIELSGQGQQLLALDWDGDGRTDAISNVGGVWQLTRSLSTTAAAIVSTGIPVTGTAPYAVTDQNGDGLNDLAYANSAAGDALYFGLHNGSAAPPDYLKSITDGWGINASPTYVPISQNNYTKYADATFPDFDFQGPMYVVSQASQSDGTGATFTNSLWYYGAHVNRQGRGFEGFYATRTIDSRNGLVRFVYYERTFPYLGAVFEDDVYQPDAATIISHNTNSWTYVDLAGTGCSVRCFPYVSSSTSATHDITAGAPLIDTTVKSYTYDNYGNATRIATTLTDNDPASPFYTFAWSTVIANTITPDTSSNWCLGKPTVTTTQSTVPGLASQTRQVNHAVDYANCRYTQETLQPGDSRLQVTTNLGYDGCGNLNSVSIIGLDQNGAAMPARTTTSGFGTYCEFAETLTNPLGQTTTTAYRYDLGVKSSVTDPNGAAVGWLYDGFARRTRESRPDGTATTWAYTDCALGSTCWGVADLKLLVTETLLDSSGATVRTHEQFADGLERLRYDEANRVLGTWTVQSTRYDSLGRKTSVEVPYSAASNGYHDYTYDLLNRPTADQLYNSSGALDRQTKMSYAGLASSITDPKGNVTTKYNDVSGKLRRIVDPSPGGTTNYTFDPFGNLVTLVDATGATATYAYNIRGFKTSAADPDAGAWTYTPNSLNETMAQTDAKGQVTSFGYDLLGRMTSRLEPEYATATQWVYGASAALHNIGHLQSVTKPDGYAESYTYDAIGRPQTSVFTEDTAYQVDYAYNALGTLDTLSYPTSTAGYRFVAKYGYSYGYLQQVKDNAAGTVFWSLSAANDSSLPTTELLGNGVQIGSTYTPWTNDLVTRAEGSGGSANNLQNLAYRWDLNQNLQQREDLRQGLTEAFVNDPMNRLTSSTLNGTTNLSVGYDAAGNITSKSDVGSYNYTTAQSGCTYYANAQPHAVRSAGSSSYCYDANGNMTRRAGNTMSWYSYNLPNLVNYGTSSSQFKYNPNRQRWMQTANLSGTAETTYYVGGILEKLVRSSGTEYRHLIPIGTGTAYYTRRSNGTASTYYITTDHLGSGDLVLDSSATVLARESFTPFGARRGSNWQGAPTSGDYTTFDTTTRRGFTGHEMLDGLSLIHMNGRIYDPYLGRMLSPDPVVSSLALSQSLNPFSYVMNNPLTLTDASGYSWLSKLFHAIGEFFEKYWRVIVAIVVAIVAWEELAPYLSSLLTPAAATAAGTVTVTSTAVIDGVTIDLTATAVYGGGITLVGGAVAGAIAGALSGGILGGWNGALAGAISGALLGAVSGYYGSVFNGQRVLATGLAGGTSSSLTGGTFWKGAILGGGIALLQWAAYAMRQQEIQSSSGDAEHNLSGTSDGMYGDHTKLAGGRWWQGAVDSVKGWLNAWQPLGGAQGGGGMLGSYFTYSPGGVIDHLLETFAGPHDFLSSFQYTADGDLATFWQAGIGKVLGEIAGGIALAPASIFATASVAPELAYVGHH